MKTTTSNMFPTLESVIKELNPEKITDERKIALQLLIDFIQSKVSTDQNILLNFICTHNSRRSHLAQIWAQTMAYFFDIKNVFCYSAGTEATALFPKIAETLQNSGFQVKIISKNENSIYSIKFSENEQPVIGFSKTIADDFNPKYKFAAIMTCSQADLGCPFVPGAEKRIPITFEDPKVYDNTELQTQKYNERSLQIANELFYVFSQIKK